VFRKRGRHALDFGTKTNDTQTEVRSRLLRAECPPVGDRSLSKRDRTSPHEPTRWQDPPGECGHTGRQTAAVKAYAVVPAGAVATERRETKSTTGAESAPNDRAETGRRERSGVSHESRKHDAMNRRLAGKQLGRMRHLHLDAHAS